jgi:hypothetical protein
MFHIGLKPCLDDLNNLGFCLKWFEAFLQKIWNNSEKQKKKNEKEIEKEEKARGKPFGLFLDPAHSPPGL